MISATFSIPHFFSIVSLQFYGYLSQQQNMMQDYVRTGTYQRAILQNHTDFKDKVTDHAAALNIRSLRGSWLPTEIMIWTSGKKIKSLDRWQIKLQVQQQTIVSVCLCDCALSCLSLCARTHTHGQRETEAAVRGRDSLMFIFIIETPSVCLFVGEA